MHVIRAAHTSHAVRPHTPRPASQTQELIYAGQRMSDNTATMASYHVPPGCQCLIVSPGGA